MKVMLQRLGILPFETAIALLLIISGVAQLTHVGLIDPVGVLLPAWEAMAFGWVTIGTGLQMMGGMAIASRRAEMAGLLLLIAVISSRFLAYAIYLGFDTRFVVTGVFDAAIIWAAITRLLTVRRGDTLIRIRAGSQ